MQNWIKKFQQYRSDVRYEGAAKEVDNPSELEVQLCEHFTVVEKEDESSYSVSSLLYEINRFDALMFEEIEAILSYEAMFKDIPNRLLC
ncbi:11914_t:CDS:2 [Racocetra fulgida]|uniref:11914_t:CDS:1 n=1 Tax=Racocetra fulgida TaxID=60492 RepID=A0A9N8ZHZ1_9GLOM|nr:11914_t:CDS:2 [Racocetra fulgida]